MSAPDDVLSTYPAEYLVCRSERHGWDRSSPRWTIVGQGVAEREAICRSCGTVRLQVVNTRTWQQIGPLRYRYAPGYTTRRSGLTLGDFRGRYLAADFDAATTDGRVDK